MSWFFHRRDAKAGGDYARARLKELTDVVDQADAASRRAFSVAIATEWRSFLAEYKSPADFRKLPSDQKMAYFEHRLHRQTLHDDTDDPAEAVAFALLNTYFSTLMSGDREVEAAAYAALEPLLTSPSNANRAPAGPV